MAGRVARTRYGTFRQSGRGGRTAGTVPTPRGASSMTRLARAAGLPFTGQSTRAVGTSGGGGFGLGLAVASISAA